MFENLTQRLSQSFKNLTGQGRFSESNIQKATKEIRASLVEADVALPVIKRFIDNVKSKALGQNIAKNLRPQEAFIKLVRDELVACLGHEKHALSFNAQPPAVILLAGLQGSGKTTSAAKLARYLIESEKKKVLLVSADIYRPAAIAQLETLANQLNTGFCPSQADEQVLDIAARALQMAKTQFADVLIVDTAGRLHVDHDMMHEIKALHQFLKPVETLFVVDSMTGQDAANTAKAFHDALPLTGVILTKTDGDARGGAALSVNNITGKPIKFMGTGEKIEALEPFYPDRVASRILGMGDILSLIEEVEKKADKESTEKLAKKIKKGQGFDLEDFAEQLRQMNNMGGLSSILPKLPGMSQLPQAALQQVNDKSLGRTLALINSMTPTERRMPKLIQGSRKRRIAQGAGQEIQDLNRLLKQFEQMQKMMKKMIKPGAMKQMMRGLGGLAGMKDMFPGKDM